MFASLSAHPPLGLYNMWHSLQTIRAMSRQVPHRHDRLSEYPRRETHRDTENNNLWI